MTTFLPPEIISKIFEHAYYDAGTPDQKTLTVCSLVSVTWTEPAQRLLFRYVDLSFDHGRRNVSVESFILATDPASEHGHRLGSYVRTLVVDIRPDEAAFKPHTATDFVQVVSHCPRLYEVVLRMLGVHDFDEKTMNELRCLTHRSRPISIRALSLLTCGVQSPILYQLLEVWPTVEFLRLGTEIAASPPSRPANFKLYELTLFRTPAQEILEWLLSASETSLEIVHFRDLPGPESNGMLAIHGPRLRSLRLMHYSLRAAAIIRYCPNLEELILFQLSTYLELAHLPASLEHLSFPNLTWPSFASLDSVVRAIDTLPRLRIVTCDPTAAIHPGYFSALQNKCQDRNIELLANTLPFRTVRLS
ncbi:hypothetical protein A0H81_08420 [Grifola frondosa]|uniref:F-box domain-containing protein n=1 Tax=Grifola frondosa TaxID=5627 RepID=A0A1C7M3L8_GRIFR|nr:hypothetical protein A0H81_08420 [Grifola frondosa]